MRLGVHVSIAGGLPVALERARALGCTAMQIFSRSPRGGPAPVFAPGALEAFDRSRRAAGIRPLAVHAPYIINLASLERAVWDFSVRLYCEEYVRAARMGAEYLVTHVGSPKAGSPEAGVRRVTEALNRVLEAPGRTLILLENSAGSGTALGAQFEQLAAMRHGVEDQARVGFCLDTAHLFAAGLPIHTAEGLQEVMAASDAVLGRPQVRLVHLNDSKSAFASGVDRHWHIGQGHIGLEAFRRIVNHQALRELPFILETPKDTDAADARNLSVVRRLTRAGRARAAA
jgi:deoxyribonuclease-4